MPLPGAARLTDAPSQPASESPKEDRPAAAFPTSYAQFSINAETQRLSIKIVDAVTNEVIREIPPEQVQRIAEDLQSLARRGAIGKRAAGAEGLTGREIDHYV